jgi:signal transduction histidine kinase
VRRAWAASCLLLLGGSWLLAARAQRQLARVARDLPAWQAEIAAEGRSALQRELETTTKALVDAAHAALAAPRDRQSAFAALDELVAANDELGIVLLREDSAFAWSGELRASVDSLRDSVGIAASQFYLTLYAVASRGADRAVAAALLSALPPADRLTQPIAHRIATESGLDGFGFTAPGRTAPADSVLRFAFAGRPLLDARALPLEAAAVIQKLRERLRLQVGALLAAALACFIIAAWRESRALHWRLAALGVALACGALVPLNEFSNLTRLFDPSVYFTPIGGALTANAGALAITSAIALLALLTILRRGRRTSRIAAGVIVVLVAGLGPFLLRDLARGIKPPSYGVSSPLWLIWQTPLFLAAVAVLLAGAGAGGVMLGRNRGLPPWVGPGLATLAAVLAPIVWGAPGQWPWWYTFLWTGAIGALAVSRQTRFVIVSAATVAALGAVTLVWGRTARGRVELAERDLASLSDADPQGARVLLERFGVALQAEPAPTSRATLLQQYVTSDLSAGGFPTALFAFGEDGRQLASFQTASFSIPGDEAARIVTEARRLGRPVLTTLAAEPALEQLLVVPPESPSDSGVATAVVIAPKTRLIAPDPFVRLLGVELDPEGEPPYTLQLTPAESGVTPPSNPRASWRRRESALHGDWIVRTGRGAAHAHVEVELRSPAELVQRGTLIVLLDLAIVGLLWTLSVVADGGLGRWLLLRRRTWARSYRLRLTIALFAFFVIPAVAFAAWSYQQLSADARRSREVLVRQTLRAVVPAEGDSAWLERESAKVLTPLLLYVGGELRDASDPLFESLAPVGRFLLTDAERLLVLGDEEWVSRMFRLGDVPALFGFRSIDRPPRFDLVVAAPARDDEQLLGRGRDDLSVFVLFATAVGALAALWLSGIAARQLARPIGSLRRGALAIASGQRLPALESEPTVEFQPVFDAFRRMAEDLNASRSALEEAQRRTAAILRNVASGVVAVDTAGNVVLANPRADVLLEARLPPGTVLADVAAPELTEAVRRFLTDRGEDEAFELELAGGQQLRVRLTPLTRGGAVVTLDDVTELARAQRVLAWGEMARQVAHEIKNPLTPIRLGVQHLRRARADRRVDFDRVLEQNVNRILAEIDRLDEIARAFSRYGSAPSERPPAVPTDIAAVVRDVVGLESMAGDGAHNAVSWRLEGAESPIVALARGEELREVLLNVLENARLAHAREVAVSVRRNGDDGAREVLIAVRDNGQGIPEDVLPRIFEPHFSTRTSGSGLGLAISRQIIDGWGGEITVASQVGQGTEVTISLKGAR